MGITTVKLELFRRRIARRVYGWYCIGLRNARETGIDRFVLHVEGNVDRMELVIEEELREKGKAWVVNIVWTGYSHTGVLLSALTGRDKVIIPGSDYEAAGIDLIDI